MQGAVFTAFSDMVIEKLGMGQWNKILEEVSPESEGIYTSVAQYADDELIAMVVALSEDTGIPVPELVKSFGEYLFSILYENSPTDISHVDNLKDFLLLIDGVIHKEVKRLYPDAYLPTFDYSEGEEGQLIMYYESKRKLCHLSEGLIEGAAAQFGQKIRIDHPECMHRGDPKCKLIVNFLDS